MALDRHPGTEHEVPLPPDRRARTPGRRRAARDAIEPADARPRSAKTNGRSRQLEMLLGGLRDLQAGDFSVRLPRDGDAVFAEIAEAFNGIAAMNERLCDEVTRVSGTVGREGRMAERVSLGGATGGWATTADSVNALISDLVQPTTETARVLTAVAEGDLSQKMTLEIDGRSVQGEFLRIGTTVNRLVDQLGAFAAEVTRVAKEVGTEGKLGGQASVPGVAGTWKDLTDNVNYMASNLTDQVRNIALVTTAVAKGDLSQKITVPARGEVLELKNTINTMVDQLGAFASEVTRVAREVGTEGVLGGQANVPGVAGTWKDLTENVNAMASNLTGQVRNTALVITAVANGDLSQKITVDVRGEMLELKRTINTMVDQLGAFAAEVTRVAKEVGTEGKLGGQARVEGVAGIWRDLTENVNAMAGNLTVQLRDVSAVATAIANGDLTREITVEARGEILQIKEVINKMVHSLGIFAGEVTRVAREVGTEGRLGGQAQVPGVAGTWKDLTDNVNYMASNLTNQVRNIADVTTAVAKGDLSRKITVDVKGEILQLKDTINTMVDQLGAFASEVTRVAREVGTEGVLGGQARVEGVAGTWKDLTDNVNSMANNLTVQVRNIADVTTAVAKGDLSQKITVDAKGEVLELKKTINGMVDSLRVFADEVTRVAREVGTDGRLGGQANVPSVAGTWKDLTDSVNSMASNLTNQVRNIADVTTAVANGDLSRKITVDVRGEILELKNTVNTMVDQLGAFAAEVTRVAREVGTEGKLGGQARVPGAAGIWRDLTDNVNSMASNLTSQVRNIALVTTAVARGDLSQKITVDVRGEILELKNTINTMVDQLGVFAAEVTRVAREVGTEGKLGGQAEVPGAAGTWKALTDNVNAMANNLTVQVRSIADVATAVTKGDLTRTVTVDAQGELAELKANLNQMIASLRETTQKNTEQDWLKTNLARFSRIMQGQKELQAVAQLIMSELTPLVSGQHGAFYVVEEEGGETPVLKLIASYAYKERKHIANRFHLGEGLVGQAALEKKPILLTNVPDDYIRITSGLGEAPPRNIIVLPVLFEGELRAVVEIASFLPFSQIHQYFLDQLAETVGVVLNMIGANRRTEELLLQSQKLTQELKQQQEELQRSNAELEEQAQSLKSSQELLRQQQEELQQVNEELEEKAALLAAQNKKVEQKNQEVEAARQALEEKAAQLALSSKYKSEFTANMSHELRTPLNSLLILARLLADNKEGNLTPKQVEYAQTILTSGSDLLTLINDVLDLSKVEAGKLEVHAAEVSLASVRDFAERSFRPVAQQKGLTFGIDAQADAPAAIYTDPQRLHQVLTNLLSNAFKFTEQGGVALTVRRADKSRRFGNPALDDADEVVAFAISDTGIGIPQDKLQLIFEAFQQVDGTTSRKYGGTGLGLSISREIARLLGGEIRVESELGRGSTFTLFLPVRYRGPETSNGGSAGGRPGGSSALGRVPAEGGRVPPAAESRSARGAAPGAAPRAEAPRAEGLPWGAPPDMHDRPRSATRHHPSAAADIEPPGRAAQVADDRDAIRPGDRVVLIVENDANFARALLAIARERGFRGVVSLRGTDALELARRFRPAAVTLDIDLAGTDGWGVLDELKADPATRHIPVHIVSVLGARHEGLRRGAIAYLEKPVSKEALDETFDRVAAYLETEVKRLLVVEDDDATRAGITELLGARDVEVTAAASAAAALDALAARRFDCVVLDLGLQGMGGFELLEAVKANPATRDLPVVVYTGRDLGAEDQARLRAHAQAVVLKDSAAAPERLLDETALFLNRVEARAADRQRRAAAGAPNGDAVFAGKHVLLVDDDVRNVFSLTSTLEARGMRVTFAENGREALHALERDPAVDLVLMDIMMPEMDGYEATQAIRARDEFRTLPIIALTAKAMTGDREKCIAAGASDYITKPVDVDRLLSLMRVWLYR